MDSARTGHESGDGIGWTMPVFDVTHNRTGRSSRRSRSDDDRGAGHRGTTIWVVVAAILVMFMQAGFAFLEAGLTRMKNVGHIAAKNVLVLGDRVDRVLPRRLRHGVRRRRQRLHRRQWLRVRRRHAARDRDGSVQLVRDRARGRRIPLRGRLLRSRSRSSGAPWRNGRSSGSTSPSASSSRSSTRRSRTGSGTRRVALREGDAGLRRLDCRPLPGRSRRARRGAPSARGSASSAPTARRTRFPGTTWRSPRSA